MQFDANLNDFNRRLADAVITIFPDGVRPLQSIDGALNFRGPIPTKNDPEHVGTHVAVSLDNEVTAALEKASTCDRESMMGILIENLGTRIRMKYDKDQIGAFALTIVGRMSIFKN